MKTPFIIEIAAAAKWLEGGLRETIVEAIGGAEPPPGVEAPRARLVPMLRRAPDTMLWLVNEDEALTYFENGCAKKLSLVGLGFGALVDIAPLSDGSVIVLARPERDTQVLARVARSGQILWRRTGSISSTLDLPALQGEFTTLLTDSDGTVYLPGTRIAWQIAAVDPANGTTSVSIDLGSLRDDHPLLAWGRIFQPPSRDSEPALRTLDLASLRETNAAAPVLRELFARVIAGLPDGGALVQIAGQDLVWLSSDGVAMTRLRIAGIVRTNGDLAAAVWEGDALVVYLFANGETASSHRLFGVPADARFDAVTSDGFFFSRRPSWVEAEEVLFYDRTGQVVEEKGFRNDPGRLMEISGRVDLTRPVVEPSGALLFAGADAKGVFVVRLRLAPH